MTCLVDEGKGVDDASLNSRKVFNTFSYSLLLENLARCTACCVKSWLDGCAQNVVVNRVKSP